jgi:sugar lactone lactonase YvrE
MSEVELVYDSKNQLGEGPIWSTTERALYWVDILDNCFHCYEPATGQHRRYDVGVVVGTVVLRASGGFVLATKRGFEFFDGQNTKMIAAPEADDPKSRFNDGAVDRQGRFWAGTMEGREGALYRLDTDLSVHKMQGGIVISNGIGWSPDNKTMYYTDSDPRTIWAYDFDAATGNIQNRRVLVQVPENDGLPDGLTVDSEGFIWSAHWDGWKITRYDPTGKIERVVRIPVQRPTSCMFGGPNLDELYFTSARTGLSEEDLKAQPHAGSIFRLKTDVKGIPEPVFGG